MKSNQILTRLKSVASRVADIQAAGKDLGLVSGQDLISLGSALKEFAEDFAFSQHLSLEAGGNNETKLAAFIAPHALTVSKISVVKPGAITGDPLLTINNRDALGNTDKNVLAATNYDLSGLATVNEAESLSLSATEVNLQMESGDVMTFTVVCDADDSHNGLAFSVDYISKDDA